MLWFLCLVVLVVSSTIDRGDARRAGTARWTEREWEVELDRRAALAGIPGVRQSVDARPLLGVKYVVAVKDSPPFIIPVVNQDGNQTFMGYSIDFLDYLSSSLGFEYDVVVSPKLTGESVVDMVANGIDGANLSIGTITLTPERTSKILFTTPYYDLGLRVVYFPKSYPPSLWQFLVPFSTQVWVAVSVVFLMVMISFAVFEGNINDKDFRSRRPVQNLFLGMYYTLETMMQQTEIRAESGEGRIVVISAMFLFFVLAATYTAELASFLTLTKYSSDIYDTNGDGTVTQEDLPSFSSILAIAKDSSIESWFVREVSRGSGGYISCESYLECIEMVASGQAGGTLYDEPIAEYGIHTNATFRDLQILGDSLNPQGYGVALQRGDPFVEYFNTAILEGRTNGITDSLAKLWIPKVARSDGNVGGLSQMYLHEVGGVFIVAVACIFLGWVVFLIKIARRKYGLFLGVSKRKRRSTDDIVTLPPETRLTAMREMLSTLNESGRLPAESVRTRLLMRMVLDYAIMSDSGLNRFNPEFDNLVSGYPTQHASPPPSNSVQNQET